MDRAPFVISVWKAQLVCAGLVFLAAMLAGAAVASGWLLFVLLVAPLVAAAGWLLLTYGPIHSDETEILMVGSIETVGIRWDEVRLVRLGWFQLVLEGQGRRVALPKPCFWSGPAAAPVRQYVETLARDYYAPPKKNYIGDLVLSRNAQRIAPQPVAPVTRLHAFKDEDLPRIRASLRGETFSPDSPADGAGPAGAPASASPRKSPQPHETPR